MKRYACILLALLFAGCATSRRSAVATAPQEKQYAVILSMDAFRWDLAGRSHTPTLDSLARVGTYAEIYPVYPSNTFPSHYAMATGLHPDHHGVVNNGFYDRTQGRRLSVFDSLDVRTPGFWGGEPIWNTAERQGAYGQHLHVAGQRSPDRRPSGDRLDPLLVQTGLLPARRLGDRRHDAPRSGDPAAGDVVLRRTRRRDAHLRSRIARSRGPRRAYRLGAPLLLPRDTPLARLRPHQLHRHGRPRHGRAFARPLHQPAAAARHGAGRARRSRHAVRSRSQGRVCGPSRAHTAPHGPYEGMAAPSGCPAGSTTAPTQPA